MLVNFIIKILRFFKATDREISCLFFLLKIIVLSISY